MHDDELQLQEIDSRIKKLEDDYQQVTLNSLAILKKIEKRLVGDIENDVPGLIYEVKQFKEKIHENEANIIKIQKQVEIFDRKLESWNLIAKDIDKLKEIVDEINKNRWILKGGLIIIGILVGKIDWLWKIIFKGGP